MSRKKKRARSQRKNEITKGIFSVLEKEPNKSFNYKQIAAKLDISDTQGRNELIKRLAQLRQKERIIEVDRGRYKKQPIEEHIVIGKVDLAANGNAYIIAEDMEEDIFVPNNKLNKAFHSDIVEVLLNQKRKGKRPEGAIVKILERAKTNFVGILELHKAFGFVRPTDPKMYTDIFVPRAKIGNATDGDKVVAAITNWPNGADSPYGTVMKVLGKPGEHGTEIHGILAEYGLPYEFPYEVEQYAQTLDTTIKNQEVARRRDMRGELTFTIDPKDAKDFDDALSFKKLENGNYEIGVHIADVTHYLPEGTSLDEEAYLSDLIPGIRVHRLGQRPSGPGGQ